MAAEGFVPSMGVLAPVCIRNARCSQDFNENFAEMETYALGKEFAALAKGGADHDEDARRFGGHSPAMAARCSISSVGQVVDCHVTGKACCCAHLQGGETFAIEFLLQSNQNLA